MFTSKIDALLKLLDDKPKNHGALKKIIENNVNLIAKTEKPKAKEELTRLLAPYQMVACLYNANNELEKIFKQITSMKKMRTTLEERANNLQLYRLEYLKSSNTIDSTLAQTTRKYIFDIISLYEFDDSYITENDNLRTSVENINSLFKDFNKLQPNPTNKNTVTTLLKIIPSNHHLNPLARFSEVLTALKSALEQLETTHKTESSKVSADLNKKLEMPETIPEQGEVIQSIFHTIHNIGCYHASELSRKLAGAMEDLEHEYETTIDIPINKSLNPTSLINPSYFQLKVYIENLLSTLAEKRWNTDYLHILISQLILSEEPEMKKLDSSLNLSTRHDEAKALQTKYDNAVQSLTRLVEYNKQNYLNDIDNITVDYNEQLRDYIKYRNNHYSFKDFFTHKDKVARMQFIHELLEKKLVAYYESKLSADDLKEFINDGIKKFPTGVFSNTKDPTKNLHGILNSLKNSIDKAEMISIPATVPPEFVVSTVVASFPVVARSEATRQSSF